ncbi:MAG: hypothetical protein JXB10_03260 [Pirellulales bacterium]|nr:hypothetical protein [Pirellulales bacterium]
MPQKHLPRELVPGTTGIRIAGLLLGILLFAGTAWGAEEQTQKTPPPQAEPGSTAKAYFRVSMVSEKILGPQEQYDEKAFEILKNTLRCLLTTRWVLVPALRDPEINQLPIVKRQKDAVEWLKENLSVTYPGNAEVMEMAFTAPEAKDAVAIVNAVADAFQREVVEVELQERRERFDELDRVYNDAEQKVRRLRSNLRNLAERFGLAVDTESNLLRQRLLLEELTALNRQLTPMDLQLTQIRVDLASQKAVREAETTVVPMEIECLDYGRNDPLLRRLAEEIALQKMLQEDVKSSVAPGSNTPETRKSTASLGRIQRQYAERIAHLQDKIKQKKLQEIDLKIKQLEASIDQLEACRARFEKEIQQIREQAEQLGTTSIEVEMYRSDLKNQLKTLQNLAAERDRLRAELRAPSRIMLLEKAELPTE